MIGFGNVKPTLRLAMIMPRIEQRDYFIHLLKLRYTVVLVKKYPDLVIYDDYSIDLVPTFKNKPVMIAFTGESGDIDYTKCDLALSFDEIHPKSIYLPLWLLFIDWFGTKDPYYCAMVDIVNRPHLSSTDRELFCGFVAQNSVVGRDNFVKALSEYKIVTCPGTVLNNYPPIGGRMGQSKEQFLRKCKFTVAFENRSKPGYITEKILHAFQSRTIPIYWGSQSVIKYFNPLAFINCHNYKTWDDVINEIKRIDNDEEAYLQMINEPVFIGDKPPAQFQPGALLASIKKFTNLS